MQDWEELLSFWETQGWLNITLNFYLIIIYTVYMIDLNILHSICQNLASCIPFNFHFKYTHSAASSWKVCSRYTSFELRNTVSAKIMSQVTASSV